MSLRSSIFSILAVVVLPGPVLADRVSLSGPEQAPALRASFPSLGVVEQLFGELASPDLAGQGMDPRDLQIEDRGFATPLGPARLDIETDPTWREYGERGDGSFGLDLIDMGFQDNATPEGGPSWPHAAGRIDSIRVGAVPAAPVVDDFPIAPLPAGAWMGLSTLVLVGIRRRFLNRSGPPNGGTAL